MQVQGTKIFQLFKRNNTNVKNIIDIAALETNAEKRIISTAEKRLMNSQESRILLGGNMMLPETRKVIDDVIKSMNGKTQVKKKLAGNQLASFSKTNHGEYEFKLTSNCNAPASQRDSILFYTNRQQLNSYSSTQKEGMEYLQHEGLENVQINDAFSQLLKTIFLNKHVRTK